REPSSTSRRATATSRWRYGRTARSCRATATSRVRRAARRTNPPPSSTSASRGTSTRLPLPRRTPNARAGRRPERRAPPRPRQRNTKRPRARLRPPREPGCVLPRAARALRLPAARLGGAGPRVLLVLPLPGHAEPLRRELDPEGRAEGRRADDAAGDDLPRRRE